MDKCVIVVDNSNLFIEGHKASARAKGIPADPHTGKLPNDYSWRIDFAGLLRQLAHGRHIPPLYSLVPAHPSMMAYGTRQGVTGSTSPFTTVRLLARKRRLTLN